MMVKIGNAAIAVVWLVNGLVCKILNLVPRHQEIVGRILGTDYAAPFTRIIGIFEICMFLWILTGIKSKICAVTQIVIILVMNCIEFAIVPDLLLFGKLNLLFALLFCSLIYLNAFIFNVKK